LNTTPRLLEVTEAVAEAGLRFLIMGGHAVRHYGIDRNTQDFDFHISVDQAGGLMDRLKSAGLFKHTSILAAQSWRPQDFIRFRIGTLPNGKDELLEFWFRNHLLPPFQELFERREEARIGAQILNFLSLSDLIRSKETERDDDWSDVRLLEEILDDRNMAKASSSLNPMLVLTSLRSRRGFVRAMELQMFSNRELIALAISQADHPVTRAYLQPFVPSVSANLEAAIQTTLASVVPGSARHLALVEAVRLAYQRAAKAADHEDKEKTLRSAESDIH
jgi:hypothetical protein